MDNEGFRIPRRFVARDAVDDELERLDQADRRRRRRNRAQPRGRVAASSASNTAPSSPPTCRCSTIRRCAAELEEHDPPAALLARVRRQPRPAPLRQGLSDRSKAATWPSGPTTSSTSRSGCCATCWAGAARSCRSSSRRCSCWPTTSRPAKRPISTATFVRGFVTEIGGPGSHTAIVAEGLEIPAVVGTGPFLTDVSGGDLVIIDGDQGLVILQPDEETLARYRHEAEQNIDRSRASSKRSATCRPKRPTACGSNCSATSSFPTRSSIASSAAADGIGLYRTEFLYLGARRRARPRRCTTQAYSDVVTAMGEPAGRDPHLDLGADKLPNMPTPRTSAIRSSACAASACRSSNLPLFRTQLRADPAGQRRWATCGIMFPLITTLLELRQAKMVLADVMEDLDEEGIAIQPRHAGRHDGRGAGRRDDDRSLRRGGRFLQHRHQRSDLSTRWPSTAATRTWPACTTPADPAVLRLIDMADQGRRRAGTCRSTCAAR